MIATTNRSNSGAPVSRSAFESAFAVTLAPDVEADQFSPRVTEVTDAARIVNVPGIAILTQPIGSTSGEMFVAVTATTLAVPETSTAWFPVNVQSAVAAAAEPPGRTMETVSSARIRSPARRDVAASRAMRQATRVRGTQSPGPDGCSPGIGASGAVSMPSMKATTRRSSSCVPATSPRRPSAVPRGIAFR